MKGVGFVNIQEIKEVLYADGKEELDFFHNEIKNMKECGVWNEMAWEIEDLLYSGNAKVAIANEVDNIFSCESGKEDFYINKYSNELRILIEVLKESVGEDELTETQKTRKVAIQSVLDRLSIRNEEDLPKNYILKHDTSNMLKEVVIDGVGEFQEGDIIMVDTDKYGDFASHEVLLQCNEDHCYFKILNSDYPYYEFEEKENLSIEEFLKWGVCETQVLGNKFD